MRLKWDKNNKGTILDDPFISKVSLGDSKMAILSSNPSDDEDVLFDESETSRLHKNDRYDDEKGSTLPTSPKLNIYKGIVFSALSSIFFSMSSAIVKYLKVRSLVSFHFAPKKELNNYSNNKLLIVSNCVGNAYNSIILAVVCSQSTYYCSFNIKDVKHIFAALN